MKTVNPSLRQLMLAVIFIGVVGLQVELALLRHAESLNQWIPHIALMVGLLASVAVYFRPGVPTLRALQGVMVIFLIVGVLGVLLHLKGNVEFALERDPSLTGTTLIWKALRGATPALAPGALAQLGLLGLLYTYRHPAFGIRGAVEVENVD